MDPDVFSFMGIMATIAGFIFLMSITRGVTHRLGGGRRGRECTCAEGDHEELEHLRERVADLEYHSRRMEELEERVDFTERLLADGNSPERVPVRQDTDPLG